MERTLNLGNILRKEKISFSTRRRFHVTAPKGFTFLKRNLKSLFYCKSSYGVLYVYRKIP